jgi:hypothetical protein
MRDGSTKGSNGKIEKMEEGAAKNAVPPSADGVNCPLRRDGKAGPVSSAKGT